MSESAPGVSLRLEALSVARGGRTVVRDVDLEIPPGQVTTLLGANGAGKSSLVLAVGGVLRASGGKVVLGDRDLTQLRPEQVRAAGVAIVPEGRRKEQPGGRAAGGSGQQRERRFLARKLRRDHPAIRLHDQKDAAEADLR